MALKSTELSQATRPIHQARSMPAGFYTDPAIFAAERERLFLKHWFFLTRAEDLPQPGDSRAFDSPGGPIVLIRGNDGQLRCFANYCRHRGSILLEGKGNVGGRITCPYHAWSYLNDGRLYGCPDMKDAEGFDKVENGLVALDLDMGGTLGAIGIMSRAEEVSSAAAKVFCRALVQLSSPAAD